MRRTVLILAALLLLPSIAFATPDRAAGGQSAQEKFAAMDKNGDGIVTREEFFDFYPQMQEAAFKAIDKNADDLISMEEWLLFAGQHTRDMGGSGMGAPGKGSTGAQMSGGMPPGGSKAGAQPPATGAGVDENRPAKPLFEFTPKNDAQ